MTHGDRLAISIALFILTETMKKLSYEATWNECFGSNITNYLRETKKVDLIKYIRDNYIKNTTSYSIFINDSPRSSFVDHILNAIPYQYEENTKMNLHEAKALADIMFENYNRYKITDPFIKHEKE